MAAQFDLVVRNGTLADGTGNALRKADVAINAGRIVEVGAVQGTGREEIDAAAHLVTPGFVDIHTHYDGQVAWSQQLAPSTQHGVTTVVLGNCGVGFAPCRPSERELLVKLMEGVEDIPEAVLTAGIPWEWETFPQYLDWLSERRFDADVATQVPHSPVRVYAMGRRGAEREPATPADLARMSEIVQEALLAGALGFSTSRTRNHRSKDGTLAPSITAGEDELTAIARGMRAIDKGVIETVDDWADPEMAFAMWERVAEAAQRPLSLTNSQRGQHDASWGWRLQRLRELNDAGKPVRGQALCRPIGVLLGFDVSLNPFSNTATYRRLQPLVLDERLQELRRPEVRDRLLAEFPGEPTVEATSIVPSFDDLFPLGDPPNYAPSRDQSVAAIARRCGRPAVDVAYDILLEGDGRAMLYAPLTNFSGYTMDGIWTMLRHPNMILGLGDGGAHSGFICDASATTFLLTYWTRDREGEKLPLAEGVRKLCSETAAALGLSDRGIVAPGYKADLNIIDYDRLCLKSPETIADLPAGGRRLLQRANGYVATIVSGVVTYRDGVATDAFPGRLIRGAQSAP